VPDHLQADNITLYESFSREETSISDVLAIFNNVYIFIGLGFAVLVILTTIGCIIERRQERDKDPNQVDDKSAFRSRYWIVIGVYVVSGVVVMCCYQYVYRHHLISLPLLDCSSCITITTQYNIDYFGVYELQRSSIVAIETISDIDAIDRDDQRAHVDRGRFCAARRVATSSGRIGSRTRSLRIVIVLLFLHVNVFNRSHIIR
jgi:nucleoid-associated protein YejK